MNIEELAPEVEMGEAARAFVESELGRCVLGMAKQEIAEAQAELETVKPSDTEKITTLQNKAKLGRMFNQWLVELIDRGNNALEIYKHGSQE